MFEENLTITVIQKKKVTTELGAGVAFLPKLKYSIREL